MCKRNAEKGDLFRIIICQFGLGEYCESMRIYFVYYNIYVEVEYICECRIYKLLNSFKFDEYFSFYDKQWYFINGIF